MKDDNESITLILLVGIRHSMCECDLFVRNFHSALIKM